MTDHPFGSLGIRWEITVTALTRRGTTKARTFIATNNGRWYDAQIGTRRQLAGHWTHLPGGTDRPVDADPTAPIHLAEGADITAATLVVILDALRYGQRPTVDLDDIKLVISQLGSRLARLVELDSTLRLQAELALYQGMVDQYSAAAREGDAGCHAFGAE